MSLIVLPPKTPPLSCAIEFELGVKIQKQGKKMKQDRLPTDILADTF